MHYRNVKHYHIILSLWTDMDRLFIKDILIGQGPNKGWYAILIQYTYGVHLHLWTKAYTISANQHVASGA